MPTELPRPELLRRHYLRELAGGGQAACIINGSGTRAGQADFANDEGAIRIFE